MTKRILFVDDEPKVLEGLRRMLRGLRGEWDMQFVESGPGALLSLDAATVDVVVTDMRMPGMSGSELLEQVAKRHPSTVRIILSGQCDRATVLRAVGPAHQFLTKPCDSELLKSAIAGACHLRDQLGDERQKCLASQVDSLPCLPAAHESLVEELGRHEPSIRRLGEVVASDPGMMLKVLQLVNSGFFGTPQRLLDPARGVDLLGVDTLRPLMHERNAFPLLQLEGVDLAPVEVLRHHCEATARAAWQIAWLETHDRRAAETARLAGWLHDIGLLVLAQGRPREFDELLRLWRDQPEEWWDRARRDDNSHTAVGAYLVGLWGLPESVFEPIGLHHAPSRSADCSFTPLTAVHVADAGTIWHSLDKKASTPSFDFEYLARIGATNRIDAWTAICREAMLEETVL